MVAEEPALRRAEWAPHTALPAQPSTRPEQAAELLTALAANAEPGDRLGTKDELRAYCGVSVGTFNEALRLVQARGVVTVRPGRVGGLFASRQSPLVRLGNSVLALDEDATSVAEAIRVRDALDPLLVQDALRHASADDLAAIRHELERMRRAADDLDRIAFVRAHWALHARIADVSPHAMLRSLYLSLLEIIERHTVSVEPVGGQLPESMKSGYDFHASLVAAITDGDETNAMALISEHRTTTPSLEVELPERVGSRG